MNAPFAIEDVCFIDFETRGRTDIKAGTYAYACDADAIVLVYAFGDEAVGEIVVRDFSHPLNWKNVPQDLRTFHDRVISGKAVYAAWHAGFDRAIWNFATLGFPEMEPHHIIDVMVQATASGLPPDLNYSAKFTNSTHKVANGKSLIQLFCVPGATATPQSHPAEFAEFAEYARGDVVAMRDVYKATRPLPIEEWKEYWAMEAINSRGVAIDLAMVKAAAALAEEDEARSSADLRQLTAGAVETVNQVQRMTDWLLERLPPEGRDILLKAEPEVDEFGSEKIPAKYALTRKQVERLLALVSGLRENANSGHSFDVFHDLMSRIERVLQIRLYGGSKTPAKFSKMLQQAVDGILYGQYVFNGAAQTGRASSKGVQIHNLARDTLPYEHEAIEALLCNYNYISFAVLGDASPVARKLSLLIRPSFVPRETSNVFVWSDWSQIEARVLPWLCDHLPGARDRLDIFREVDDDPSKPDLYTRTAAAMFNMSLDRIDKERRQAGKIAELALGFGGGKGALQGMAANYGVFWDDALAQELVKMWREVNHWAVTYSEELWDTSQQAMADPARFVQAGRCGFRYFPGYLGGSLLCRLPSGRWLTYRSIRWEEVDVKDSAGKVIKRQQELTYARGHGRAKLWPGIFVENVTQAVAADILRGTLLRLNAVLIANRMPVRLHTHDEILVEVPEAQASLAADVLREIMRQGFDWSEGLPLMSEETIAPYYTKRI